MAWCQDLLFNIFENKITSKLSFEYLLIAKYKLWYSWINIDNIEILDERGIQLYKTPYCWCYTACKGGLAFLLLLFYTTTELHDPSLDIFRILYPFASVLASLLNLCCFPRCIWGTKCVWLSQKCSATNNYAFIHPGLAWCWRLRLCRSLWLSFLSSLMASMTSRIRMKPPAIGMAITAALNHSVSWFSLYNRYFWFLTLVDEVLLPEMNWILC